ncbi:MAG: type I methionyl aminopeptidase [Patescibacteria group bacterium]
MIKLKTEKDLVFLRKSGKILSSILNILASEAKEGVALIELDLKARKLLKDAGAKAAFLDYRPAGAAKAYPAAICASVNDVIVHGLPNEYVLKSGDVLKIDFGVNYSPRGGAGKGYFTDSALTVGIGNISKEALHLIEATKNSLAEAIKVCKPGNHLGDIGFAIESVVKKEGFKVVHGLTGHGVGFKLHEDPTILNYGKRGEGIMLTPGMVLAIEPMVAIGSSEIIQQKDDSFATADHSLSAHFEHTVAITDNGTEILTF